MGRTETVRNSGIERLKKGEKKMKMWYVLVYENGNRAIIEKEEYEKEMIEQYGVDPTIPTYYDDAIAGVIESETEPTWDDLVYDSETRQYYLK